LLERFGFGFSNSSEVVVCSTVVELVFGVDVVLGLLIFGSLSGVEATLLVENLRGKDAEEVVSSRVYFGQSLSLREGTKESKEERITGAPPQSPKDSSYSAQTAAPSSSRTASSGR
jgi:hypothetical protein